MKKIAIVRCCLLFGLGFGGCASIVNGGKENMAFESQLSATTITKK